MHFKYEIHFLLQEKNIIFVITLTSIAKRKYRKMFLFEEFRRCLVRTFDPLEKWVSLFIQKKKKTIQCNWISSLGFY
jgi:hypothetical protein